MTGKVKQQKRKAFTQLCFFSFLLSEYIEYYCSIGVVATTDVVEACKDVNVAVMVGGFPRKEGMERKDVMSKNVSIYKAQASALEQHAAPDCKVKKNICYSICNL